MSRIRSNVASLPAGDETLLWYGRAVAELRKRELMDPVGWRYMAAVHGAPPWPDGDPYHIQGEARPGQADRLRFWDQCQHQTWYFLPWHRAYLAAFEAIVAKTVEELGGPAEWALPYWDYTVGAASRIMPAAFCNEKVDGEDNPLWLQWGRTDDGDMGFGDDDVSVECLKSGFFSGVGSGGEVGFAGPVSEFMHFGSQHHLSDGRIEAAPHNNVHSQIGGLMGDPRYAALDPIFWLHHSNIDRLWEVWRRKHPDLADPSDGDWRTGVAFEVHVVDGSVWKFRSEDMLNTTAVLHGYVYDDVEPAEASLGAVDVPEIAPDDATLAGASEGAVDIVDGEGGGSLKVGGNAVSLSVFEASPKVFLNLENMVGRGEDANFDVYARDASAGGDAVKVGQVSMFGLEAASDPEATHGGGGLSKVVDITPFADALNLTTSSETQVDVSFRRRTRRTKRPGFLERDGGSRVRIGRVSVYYAPGDPE